MIAATHPLTTRASPAPSPSQAAQHPVRVLLADDHHVTLWGLRQLLESATPPIEVVGTATSAKDLLDHPSLTSTDVVLLDLGLSDRNALECLQELVQRTGVKVVVLTGDTDPGHHRDAVMRGARGMVLKSQPAEHIISAIHQVQAGSVWLEAGLVSVLLGRSDGTTPPKPAAPSMLQKRIASLTPKEREVVQALVTHRGAKSLVVAEALLMSEHTFRNHLTVVYSKLGVHGKLNLYVFALEHGLAKAGSPPSTAAALRAAQPPSTPSNFADSDWYPIHD
jgi:DNA-binding NarL/FixJ family response regulator